MEEVGGGWRPYSRGWQALTPGPGVAAVLPTRVSSARQGGGSTTSFTVSVLLYPARRHLCHPLGASARGWTRGRLFYLASARGLCLSMGACGEARRTAERRRRRRGNGGLWSGSSVFRGGARRGVDGGGGRGSLKALSCCAYQIADVEMGIGGRRRRRRVRRLDRRRDHVNRRVAG